MSAKNYAFDLLKEHEGFRQKPYLCTGGKWTIGIGYNLEAHGYTAQEIDALNKDGWTQAHAERMLQHEIDVICAQLAGFEWWVTLDDVRRAVVIDMACNLGFEGFRGFKKLAAALAAHDWEKAVFEMRNSKWAKQVPSRCAKLCRIMKAGVIDDN